MRQRKIVEKTNILNFPFEFFSLTNFPNAKLNCIQSPVE